MGAAVLDVASERDRYGGSAQRKVLVTVASKHGATTGIACTAMSGPTALDALITEPRLVEVDHVDVAAAPKVAWDHVRHGDLGGSPLIRALFAVRTLPSRLTGRDVEPLDLRIDGFASTDRPGFRLLAEETGREVVVGAVGRVWEPDIPF